MGCVDLLSRSKDANVLSLASDIANSVESKDLAITVAGRSVALSLSKQDFEGAEITLELHPNLKVCLFYYISVICVFLKINLC